MPAICVTCFRESWPCPGLAQKRDFSALSSRILCGAPGGAYGLEINGILYPTQYPPYGKNRDFRGVNTSLIVPVQSRAYGTARYRAWGQPQTPAEACGPCTRSRQTKPHYRVKACLSGPGR